MLREQPDRVKDALAAERARDSREPDMHGHQRESQLVAREHHSPKPRAAQFGKQLGVARKAMARAVEPFLVDRRGDQRVASPAIAIRAPFTI